jgi:hypothetical protein
MEMLVIIQFIIFVFSCLLPENLKMKMYKTIFLPQELGSSVITVSDYGLDDHVIMVLSLVEAKGFFL